MSNQNQPNQGNNAAPNNKPQADQRLGTDHGNPAEKGPVAGNRQQAGQNKQADQNGQAGGGQRGNLQR